MCLLKVMDEHFIEIHIVSNTGADKSPLFSDVLWNNTLLAIAYVSRLFAQMVALCFGDLHATFPWGVIFPTSYFLLQIQGPYLALPIDIAHHIFWEPNRQVRRSSGSLQSLYTEDLINKDHSQSWQYNGIEDLILTITPLRNNSLCWLCVCMKCLLGALFQ